MRCILFLIVSSIICCCDSSQNFESCVVSNDYIRFKSLVDNCENIKDIKDAKGDTVLHYAVKYGRFEMVKKIIDEKKIDIDVKNSNNETPLFYATKFASNDIKIVEYLLSHGASVDSQNGIYHVSTPICNAISLGNINVIQCILKHKPNLNIPIEIKGKSTNRKMHILSAVLFSENDVAILKLLLKENIDLLIRKDLGLELLSAATFYVSKNWKGKMKCLIDNKIDINSRSETGFTFMMKMAADANAYNVNVMKYFLQFNPDPFVKNNEGLTAYDIANRNGNEKMIETIKDYMEKYRINSN